MVNKFSFKYHTKQYAAVADVFNVHHFLNDNYWTLENGALIINLKPNIFYLVNKSNNLSKKCMEVKQK